MATTIQNLYSLTAGNKPGDLLPGEIAYNVADGFMYLGNGTSNYTDTLGNVIGPSTNPGGGWQQAVFNASPVNGSVVLGGIYDAQSNLVTSVTAAGTTAGLVAGDPLPASSAGNTDIYVLVQIGGVLTPPAPTGTADPGDWLVSSGNGWSLVQQASATVPAENVTITPTGPFTGPNMQQVLNEIQLDFVSSDNGSCSYLAVNNDLSVFGNTILGNDSSDTTTVTGNASFNNNVTVAGVLTANGNVLLGNQLTDTVTCAGPVSMNSTLNVAGTFTALGSVTLGNQTTDTVSIAGPVIASNNLQVNGSTVLNGATTVNGALATTNSVTISGAAGVTVNSNVSFLNGADLTLNANSAANFNGNIVFCGNNTPVTIQGAFTMNAGYQNQVVTYARPAFVNPISGAVGGVASDNLNTFLVIPGTIIAYAYQGYTPKGYIWCDGGAVKRSDYPDLFAAIGTTWGIGDGSTTFNLPDLRGLFLRGASGNNSKVQTVSGQPVTGGNTGSYQSDSFQTHNHTLTLHTGDYGAAFKTDIACLMLNNDQMQGVSGGRNNEDRQPLTQQNPRQPIGFSPTPTGLNETRPVNATVTYFIKY